MKIKCSKYNSRFYRANKRKKILNYPFRFLIFSVIIKKNNLGKLGKNKRKQTKRSSTSKPKSKYSKKSVSKKRRDMNNKSSIIRNRITVQRRIFNKDFTNINQKSKTS